MKMKTLKITHFFDVIKKESNVEPKAAAFITNDVANDLKINSQLECYIKEEVDIPWSEPSCNVDKSQNDTHSVEKHNDMFNARVIIDKLPDSIVQKYCNQSEIKMKNTDNRNRDCSSSIVQEKPVEKKNRSLRIKNRKSKMNLKETNNYNTTESKLYWKICTACNKKHEIVLFTRKMNECRQCKTRLTYECKKCHKQLSSIAGIKWHVKSKCLSEGYYYKCFECDYKSANKADVGYHIKRKHPTLMSQVNCLIEKVKSENIQKDLDKNKHQCPRCEKRFVFQPMLIRHLEMCTGTQSTTENENQNVDNDILAIRKLMMLYCEKCDKDVMYSTMMKSKLQKGKKKCINCKSIMAFKCLECKRQCTSRHGMAAHIRSKHFATKEYKCSKCDFKTSLAENLSRHYNKMHVSGIHECSKCGIKYDTHCRLRVHLLRCGLEPQYNCDHCSYNTYYRGSLEQHMFRMHSPLNEIECPNCKKIQRNEQCLKEHLRMCKMKDYLKCQFCSYKTKSITTLRYHTSRLHAEGKNICTVMGRSGKYYDYLSNYQCDHCSYQCRGRNNIYDHIVKNHLKEKNIACSKCGKKFRNTVYLRVHLKYCGLKPYLHCAHCPFQTYLKGQLTVHIEKKHSTFECSRCKRIIKGKENFRIHWKKHCKML